MLREATPHADWCEKTMSMMREKQFEACERRLSTHSGLSLFSPEATDWDAQALLEDSYYGKEGHQKGLATLESLRMQVLALLPLEASFLPHGERDLLERLLVAEGRLSLTEWDDIGAAEALLSRLWCCLYMGPEDWTLILPQALHQPLALALASPEKNRWAQLMLRYNGMMMGLLYIMGFLHGNQPIDIFQSEVMDQQDPLGRIVARRYLQSAFEYVTDGDGALIFVHPGLAEPHRILASMGKDAAFALELSQSMVSGGMNGILPQEEPLHLDLYAALQGNMRPEYDAQDAAEDLRILAKQGVSLEEMQKVMQTMICVLPTPAMNHAVQQLHLRTPAWASLQAAPLQ